MFNLFRFVYNIGAKQERQRIKIAIAEVQRELSQEYSRLDFNMRDDETREKNREQLEKQIAINRKVVAILDSVTSPRGHWVNEGGALIDGDK